MAKRFRNSLVRDFRYGQCKRSLLVIRNGERMSNIVNFKKPSPNEFDNLLKVLRFNSEEKCPGVSLFSPIRMVTADNWPEIIGYHRGFFSAKVDIIIDTIEAYLAGTKSIERESILYDELVGFNERYVQYSYILTVAIPTNEKMWTMTFVWNGTSYLITDIYYNEVSMNREALLKTMEAYSLTSESFHPEG